MKLRVAARGSRLSLIQVRLVLERLARVKPGLEFELVIVRTRGDVHRDRWFHEIGKGVFEKEVNMAVLRGEADIAVHSLKDVPSSVDPRLVLAMTPPRDPPFDALVVRADSPLEPRLHSLPSGAVVGTTSSRRRAMLLHSRPDLRVEKLRGNVDTRVRRVVEGRYDAAVLAEAGLVRLGVGESWGVRWERIPPEQVMPAPCQGIIGVYAPAWRRDLLELLAAASDEEAMAMARAERALLDRAGGGCQTPLGAYSWITSGGTMYLRAAVLDAEGRVRVDVRVSGSPSEPELLGFEAAEELRARAPDLLSR